MEIVITIVIWGLMVWGGVALAKQRNRDVTTWGILSLLFGIFAIIALLIMGEAKTE